MPRLNNFQDFKQLLKEKLAISKEIADISKEIPAVLKREWFNWLSSQPYHSYITNEFHDKRDFLFCVTWNEVTKQFDVDLEETFYQFGLFKIPQIKETICPRLINFVNRHKICGNFFLTISFSILGEIEIAINWKELLSVSSVEKAMERSNVVSEVRLTRTKRENNDIIWKYNRNFWHFNPLEEQKKKDNFWDELIKTINEFTSEVTLNPLFGLLIIFLDINSTIFIGNNSNNSNSSEFYNKELKRKLTSEKAELYWEIWNNRIQPLVLLNNNTTTTNNIPYLKTNLERVKLFNEITNIHSSHQAYEDLKKWINVPNLNRL